MSRACGPGLSPVGGERRVKGCELASCGELVKVTGSILPVSDSWRLGGSGVQVTVCQLGAWRPITSYQYMLWLSHKDRL